MTNRNNPSGMGRGVSSTMGMLQGFGLTGNDPMIPRQGDRDLWNTMNDRSAPPQMGVPDLNDPTNRDSIRAMLTPGGMKKD